MPDRPIPTSYAHLVRVDDGKWARAAWLIAGLILIVAVPLAMGNGSIAPEWVGVAIQAQIFIVGAVGLMLLSGVTGQLSLGHAAFLAVGGFAAANLALDFGLPWWVVLPLAGLISALVGVLIAPFAFRLKGLYLAIVTLGLVFVIQHVLLRWTDISGGHRGTAVPMFNGFVDDPENMTPMEKAEAGFGREPWEIGGVFMGRDVQMYVVFLLVTVAACLFARNVLRTRMGRAMAAVGSGDIAASVLGIRVKWVKTAAFGLSSFYAGVAGAMWGWKQTYLTVDPPFDLHLSMEFVAMIFIGGLGTVMGAVLGAILFASGRPLAAELAELPFLRDSSLQEGDIVLFVFGATVIVFMLFEPRGLRGIWSRVKRYFTTWPVK
ncbi:branched-chain amino acid ABC transporter permease [Nocardioides daejeonensis]|uniref:branched-chain amino acid ABC transporter permease n=1 Tax=Nocardioides daejeonensis TaxID=1046556 RepID=UPI000D74D7B9|nr:branched-chain amino acid ABC transporter permease [Nocardioides daejeonensis]